MIWAICGAVVVTADHLRANADWVLRQADTLGDVLLEHEPEAASLLEPVDLGPQVLAQLSVLDFVEEDVQFASDHAVRLSVGRWWFHATLRRLDPVPATRVSCGRRTRRGSGPPIDDDPRIV